MNKRQTNGAQPFTLDDAQIQMQRTASSVSHGPPVATAIHSGKCWNMDSCRKAGGVWVPPGPGMPASCMGATCSDKGTGDWD